MIIKILFHAINEGMFLPVSECSPGRGEGCSIGSCQGPDRQTAIRAEGNQQLHFSDTGEYASGKFLSILILH